MGGTFFHSDLWVMNLSFSETASVTRTWEAFETFQISGLFAAVGAGGAVTTDAWLAVSASAPLFPFVTVIDNQSGDSTWVVPWEDAASAP